MAAKTAPLPRVYGRYRIQSELGRGAMGVVYKAHDPQIDRSVALKVLRQGHTSSEHSRARLLKEAQAIGRLSHPNIVTVFDAGQDHGTVFLAEEFVEGQSLNLPLKHGALDPPAVISLGIQLAQALAYAHAQGIVHRDIKSYNIICQPDGRVKLTDFGIARVDDAKGADATRPGEIMGTPAYMAPELLGGTVADARSDLFSLGVVMYEAAAGQRPFQGDSVAAVFGAIRDKEPPPPGQLNPRVPALVSDIIMTCLAKNPARRFQSGDDLLAALRKCLPETYVGPPQTPPQTVQTGRRRWLVLLSAWALLLGIGLSLWALLRKNEDGPYQKPTAEAVVIDIRSDPAGAIVFIDGFRKGQTPVVVRLVQGDYRLHLEAKGFYDHASRLTVDGPQAKPLVIKLKPLIF